MVFISISSEASLRLNEVMVNPNPGTNTSEVQSLVDCDNPTFGAAWIELYNFSQCDTIFLDCYIVASQTSGSNGGAFTFPAGSFIAPLDFVVIGGPDAPNVDYLLPDFCNTPSLCTSDTWSLANDFGWVALYAPDGTVTDAFFYTESTGQATDLGVNPNFDLAPCVPLQCDNLGALQKANEMTPGTEIFYTGIAPPAGESKARSEDGLGSWQTVSVPTPGDCNGTCAEPDDLEILIEVVQNETCEQSNGIVTFSIEGGSEPYSIEWFNESQQDTLFNLSAGDIEVVVTDVNGCRDEDFALLLNEGAPPDLEVIPENPAIFLGEFVGLELQASNAIVDAAWSPSNGLSCQSCLNPLAAPGVTTTYNVEVLDEFGCTQSTTVRVEVVDDAASIFIPNAFTPNQAENNQLFVRSPRIQSMNFRVYDRWGNVVFQTTTQSEGWDGTDPSGNPLQTGVFIYQLEVVLENGTERTLSGNINLIR